MSELTHQLTRVLGHASSSVVSALRTRIELISEEWRIERTRSLFGAILAVIVGGGFLLALTALLGAMVLSMPPEERVDGLLISSGILFACCLVFSLVLWRWIGKAQPFHHSVEELKKDVQCLLDIARTR